MKPLNFRLNLISRALLSAAVSLTILFVIGCQRTIDQIHTENVFDVAAAKEWYYGVFKKSPEWASSVLHGKKLPDWKNPISRKIGNMEIIEFPLITARKQIFILSNENLNTADKRRITEASLARISFIRHRNKVTIRETYYIPTLAYLQQNGYDISHVSLLNADNKFEGQVVTKTWKGDIVSIKQMANGKMFRTLKLANTTAPTNGADQANTLNDDCFGAEDTWECIFEQACVVTTYAEGIQVEECEWINTGQCWPVECVDDPNPCEGLTDEQCACELYGFCGEGGEEDEDECEQQCISDFSSTPVSEIISDELGTPELNSSGVLVRKDQFSWYFNTSSLLNWTWKYKSFEATEAEKINGVWKFTKVEHVSEDWDGSLPPCMGTTVKINNPTPNILDNGERARMDLAYKVTMKVTCCPLCPDTYKSGSSWAEWPCKQ